jgi:hypothetical protein
MSSNKGSLNKNLIKRKSLFFTLLILLRKVKQKCDIQEEKKEQYCFVILKVIVLCIVNNKRLDFFKRNLLKRK